MNGDCPSCGEPIEDYSSPQHRCGHFLGWPNYRKAASEQPDLRFRYQAASNLLLAQGLSNLQAKLEEIARDSYPVITMTCEACDDLLRGVKYRNYHAQVDVGNRPIAPEVNHGDRLMVNERIYPSYGRYLHYAILSPQGDGLKNYGDVAVSWNVTDHYLGIRSTLLEENEFVFFDRHRLGALGAVVPSGYRATWADRALLVVAKLAPLINSSTAIADLPNLVLAEGTNRMGDQFMEVVIYAEEGIDSRDIRAVTLMRPMTDPERQRRWQLVLESGNRLGITVT